MILKDSYKGEIMKKSYLKKKEKALKKLLRPEVKAISPYKGEEDNFKVKINLAGNESPFDLPEEIKEKFKKEFDHCELNRYPEIYSETLQQKLANYLSQNLNKKLKTDQIIAANGSDEILDILIRTFVQKGDVVLSQAPSFSMYKYFTEINGGKYEEIPLDENVIYQNIKKEIDLLKPKLVILCSPNNPTGEVIDTKMILKLADYFAGPLVVDEAYAEFSDFDLMSELDNYPNLAVSRTFSKAFGLAGIRFGYLYGSKLLVEELKKVLKPYNLNIMTDIMASLILENDAIIKERINFIKSEREKLYQKLKQYQGWQIYPSMANFIYIKGEKTKEFKKISNQKGIKIRSYNKPPAVRITVGSKAENEAVLDVFAEFKREN